MSISDQQLDDGRCNQLYTIGTSDANRQDSHLQNISQKSRGWTERHTFALMNFIGQTLAFMNRTCLSITLVAMVTSSSNSTDTDHGDVCPLPEGMNNTAGPLTEGEFDWDEQLQGVLMGSFFYGYVCTCFVGGLAAEYFGSHLMFGLSILGQSVLSVFSPISARTSVELFIAVRVVSGISQGPMYPSLHSLMATWVPPKLRAVYNAFCLSGCNMGTVLAMALGGLLSSSTFLGGWPSVFYIFGGTGILWSILWFLLVKPEPTVNHPNDSEKEKATTQRIKLKDVHWKAIFLSLPFWSLVFLHVGDSFGYFTLSSEIPTYLSKIQYFDLSKDGLLSSLPYILQVIFSIVWGLAANYFTTSQRLSVLSVRRVSTAVGMYCGGAALVAMCFVDCNSTLAVVLLCVAVAVTGASNSGGYLGEQDMCPSSLVGIIKGMSTTISSSTGFLAPMVAGTIIAGNETLSAWRLVFLIAAAFMFVTGTIFLIFCTDKVQPWIKSEKHKETDKY